MTAVYFRKATAQTVSVNTFLVMLASLMQSDSQVKLMFAYVS